MPRSRRIPRNDSVDDYPVRPRDGEIEEQMPAKTEKRILRTLVLFSLTYFLYGCGISIYGPLYPREAKENGLSSCIYGAVIATSHFVSILIYPLVCRMVSSVSSRLSLSVSIFVIGACRVLFGTLALISDNTPFIAESFAIQIVEGIGISILMTTTVVTVCAGSEDQIPKIFLAIESSLSAGLAIGPIAGGAIKEAFGYGMPFYIIGGLTVLSFICIAVMLPEPDQRIAYEDLPVIFWLKDGRMIIYFFIVFASFSYVGFLSISLEHLLRQFHLRDLYVGLMFSISPFVFSLTSPGWTWLIKKWCNSVMLIFFGSILIFVSLILLGPAPFSTIKASLANVSSALALVGLGIACKTSCVIEGSKSDLRYRKNFNEIQQKLIVPVMFSVGTFLGYFVGSLTTGFANFYIGYRKATLIFFGLEACIGVTAVIFAFNRNYVSKRYRGTVEERQEIMQT